MTILERMAEFAARRASKFEPLILKRFFSLRDLTSLTWIGTFAWSNQEMKQRWLDDAVVIDLHGTPQVPPEVARDYLRAKYIEPRRHTTSQFQAINEKRAVPLYARIGSYSDMAYVDIKAAYWSIIQIVGWDVDYHPARWLGKRSDNDDFPIPENKIARNSLVSVGLITRQHIWNGVKLQSLSAHNPYVNYDIWAIAQDVLHSLATIALKAGAVHIHTDGYIVPAKHAHRLIEEIGYWGLTATIKAAGDAVIHGVGSYTIGDKATKHQYKFTRTDVRKVYEPDVSWLRVRMHKLARTAIRWKIDTE